MTEHIGASGTTSEGASEPFVIFKHVGLLLGLLLLVKAYGVAHFSLTTTGSLITTKPLDALLGMIASYAYLALPLLAIGVTWWLWEKRATLPPPTRAAGVTAVLVSVVLSPWTYLWLLLLIALPFAAAALVFKRQGDASGAKARRDRLLASYCGLVAAIFLLATIDKPWVPAEVIVTKHAVLVKSVNRQRQQNPAVYVLDASGGDFVALDAKSRFIMHIPASEVSGRIVCHATSQLPGHAPILYAVENRFRDKRHQKQYDSPNASCKHVRQWLRSEILKP